MKSKRLLALGLAACLLVSMPGETYLAAASENFGSEEAVTEDFFSDESWESDERIPEPPQNEGAENVPDGGTPEMPDNEIPDAGAADTETPVFEAAGNANSEEIFTEESVTEDWYGEGAPTPGDFLELPAEDFAEPGLYDADYTEDAAQIYGNYYYKVRTYTETGAKEVVLTGVVLDKEVGKDYIISVNVPETIGGLPVTTIGNGAFSGCKNLTSVVFSKNVKRLYSNAFAGDTFLNNVTIPLNVEVIDYYYGNPAYRGPFSGCTGLTKVTLPQGMSSIPSGLFEGCGSLSGISIPDTVTKIDASAFEGCRMLSGVTLPKGLKEIGNRAFLDCVSLKGVVLPEGLSYLGCGAFGGCTSLTEINLPLEIKLQDNTGANYQYPGPFAACSSLKTVRFAEGTDKVLAGLFYQCSGLTDLTLPKTITKIESNAFKDCQNLTSIHFPENLKEIWNDSFTNCSKLTGVTFPNGMELLARAAFANCSALKSIHIPTGMKTEGYCGANGAWAGPFPGCDNLKNVTFEAGITTIPNGLLWCNGGIEEVHIPKTVKNIQHRAFNTGSLKRIYFEGEAPDMNDAIQNTENLTAYVYSENWKSFTYLRSIYNKVNWVMVGNAGAEGVTTGFDTELNYCGYAYAYAPLMAPDKTLRINTEVRYKYRTWLGSGAESVSTETFTATSDENGYILFKTPLLTYEKGSGETDIRRYDFFPAEEEGNLLFHDITLNVKVTPLSFTQTLEAVGEAGIELSLGAGGEAGIGNVAEVDASLLEGSLGANSKYGLSVSLDKYGASTDMTFSTSCDAGLMAKLDAGPGAELLNQKIKVLNAQANISAGNLVVRGITLQDIENMTPAKQAKLGKFLFFMILGSAGGNVGVNNLIRALNLDDADFYSSTAKLSAGGEISPVKLKLGNAKATIGNLGTAFTVSAGKGENLLLQQKTDSKSLNVKNKASLAKVNLTDNMFLSADGYLSGSIFLNYINDTYHKTKNAKFGTTTAKGAGGTGLGAEWADKKTYTLDEAALNQLESGNYLNNGKFIWALEDYARLANGVVSILDEVPVTETRENTQKVSLEFEPKLKLGVGAKLKLGIAGITGQEYDTGTGVYLSGKGITRYDTTTELEKYVNAEKIDIVKLLWEAEQKAESQVKELFGSVTSFVKDGVSYLGAKVDKLGNAVKNWKVTISGMKKEKVVKASYQIQTFATEAAALSGDIPAEAAVTVGEPYTIYVEDEAGNEITDFTECPLPLTLTYTAENLALAGMTEEQAADLDIYFYDEVSDTYVWQRGSHNAASRSVTAQILKPGQYILAADTSAPTIKNIAVSDPSSRPTVTAEIAEVSGFSEFSFAIDGKELVKKEDLKNCYNHTSGIFTYSCKDALSEGKHSLSFRVKDEKGFAAEEAFTFEVDVTPPEIKEASATVKKQTVSISAKVTDKNPGFVYGSVDYTKKAESYSETVDLEETDGIYTGTFELERGAFVTEIRLTAVDEAGNTSTETLYKKTAAEAQYRIPAVSLGGNFTAYLNGNKSLWMWGNNDSGQIGNGKSSSREKPQKIMDNVVQISAGKNHMAAVTADGGLYLWGSNNYGKLGDGSGKNQYRPVKIMDNVASVSLGDETSAAVTRDGSLYTWGDNYYGQLGTGDSNDCSTPVKVMDNVASVSVGMSHMAAVTTDGTLYAWGGNSEGQLGNWTKSSSKIPVEIMGKVEAVSLGNYHSAAVTENGSLYVWGYNSNGQVGNNSYTSCMGPVKILDNISLAELGSYHSAAVSTDGKVYVWGSGGCRLGREDSENVLAPVLLDGNADAVSCGASFTAVLRENGQLAMCGYNNNKQISWDIPESEVAALTEIDISSMGGGAVPTPTPVPPTPTPVPPTPTPVPPTPTPKPTAPTPTPTPKPTAPTPTPKPCSHSFGGWSVVKSATALETGLQTRKCTKCGYAETAVIGKLKPFVKLNATKLPMKQGQTTTKLKVAEMAAGDYVVSWKSSSTKIVKVSSSGKLTAQRRNGTAYVTAKLASGVSAKVKVTVSKATVKTTGIYGLSKKMTLARGKYANLKPQIVPITSQEKVRYTSSNKRVATVTSGGKIKAVSSGTAKITVQSGKKKTVITVTVPTIKTTKLTGVPKTKSLKKGKTYQLRPKRTPSNSGEKITYSSSNKKAATVSSTGKIKAVKKGKTKITVKSGKIKVTCYVTVY